jgi:hypothetical protein
MGLYIHKDREGKLAVLEDLDTRALAFFCDYKARTAGQPVSNGQWHKGPPPSAVPAR